MIKNGFLYPAFMVRRGFRFNGSFQRLAVKSTTKRLGRGTLSS